MTATSQGRRKPRRPRPARTGRRGAGRWETRRAWFLVAGILLVLLGVVIGRWNGAPRTPGDEPAPVSELREAVPGDGTRDVPAARAAALDATADAPFPAPQRGGALVALVIDDLGRSVDTIDRLAALGVDMSYSVLPFESRTQQVVRELNERGAEILLHLPMEADGAADPGPGSLLLSMNSEELRRRTREALAAVPGAIGANNHMGSALSSDGAALEPVLVELGERGLFFLDSRTTADSVGFRLARELGIPAAERRIFLDREIDRDSIRAQFRRLLEQAAERGSAIAIGHPYEETLDVLRQEVPLAKEAGFRFVPVSYLMERSGVEAM